MTALDSNRMITKINLKQLNGIPLSSKELRFMQEHLSIPVHSSMYMKPKLSSEKIKRYIYQINIAKEQILSLKSICVTNHFFSKKEIEMSVYIKQLIEAFSSYCLEYKPVPNYLLSELDIPDDFMDSIVSRNRAKDSLCDFIIYVLEHCADYLFTNNMVLLSSSLATLSDSCLIFDALCL